MRVHMEKRGQGDPIVLLHGMGSSSETRAAQLAALEGRFTVVASLDHKPVLVGHSLGGYLSLAYSATRPGSVHGMVVTATGPGFHDREKRAAWNARAERNAHRFGVEPQVAGLNLQHDGLVMEALAHLDAPTLVLAGTDDAAPYAASGTYLERKMPNASFAVIEGGKHMMHEESHAAEIAELITEFVGALSTEEDEVSHG